MSRGSNQRRGRQQAEMAIMGIEAELIRVRATLNRVDRALQPGARQDLEHIASIVYGLLTDDDTRRSFHVDDGEVDAPTSNC